MKDLRHVPMAISRHSSTHIGALINQGLTTAGESLRSLAEECGVSAGYLVKLRRGKIRHPREDILECMARVLDQEVDDYHVALLADHGELPRWSKVLGAELDVRLNNEDEQAIAQFVEAMIKSRRGT